MRIEYTSLMDALKQCGHLFALSDKEIGETSPLSPDELTYRSLDAATRSFAAIAYDDNGTLAGMASVILYRDPHHAARTIAENDVLYVLPEHRSGTLAGRLMIAIEKEAGNRGASIFQWHAAFCSELWRTMYRRDQDYKPLETVFRKELACKADPA